ncbi:hypothetical protein PO878_04035 [Iamia majanohamensis]|uniref:Uncharacterized protein n=1 Tax=Iamia majanohamensis TaxID=467976 RepID=A0AAE9YG39_9ACTN|nr:hypothetical protein [Iamia majanohamensis]WCO67892.1 hypothetical protein PO878_04035 [Iamia majanohamensis]
MSAERPQWSVAVPESHVVRTHAVLARYVDDLAERSPGKVARWRNDLDDSLHFEGADTDPALPTWLEAIARDPEAANRLHRERHPILYPPSADPGDPTP